MRKQNKNHGNLRHKKRQSVEQGDIPHAPKMAQQTISCIPPKVSDIFVLRTTTVSATQITGSGTVTTVGGFAFTLSDCDGYSTYTSVFDQYRIDAVSVTLRACNNAIGLVTNSTTTLEPLYLVIDYDNANTPSSIAALREYDNCMVVSPGESVTRTFAPHAALGAYNGSFAGYANVGRTWIDCASTGVQHYGYKYGVPAATTGQTLLQSWIVERTYWISFRRVAGGN